MLIVSINFFPKKYFVMQFFIFNNEKTLKLDWLWSEGSLNQSACHGTLVGPQDKGPPLSQARTPFSGGLPLFSCCFIFLYSWSTTTGHHATPLTNLFSRDSFIPLPLWQGFRSLWRIYFSKFFYLKNTVGLKKSCNQII